MGKSTATRARRKPAKPYPTFPLYPHASGRWAKKILGRVYYFGRWGVKKGASIVPFDDQRTAANEAKAEFDRQSPALYDGEMPAPKPSADGKDIFDLREEFLASKTADMERGKLSPRTFYHYKRAADQLFAFFGADQPLAALGPKEFSRLYAHIAKGKASPVYLGNEIRHIRVVLNYAIEKDMVPRAFKYGPDFKLPTKRELRRNRQELVKQHGKKMLEASDIRAVLTALLEPQKNTRTTRQANLALRAMTLLGVNGGLGQTDCAHMELSHLHLDTAWLDYPRVKTTVERRIPLWPETVQAIRDYLAVRKTVQGGAYKNRVFLTDAGRPWVDIKPSGYATDSVSTKFTKLLSSLGLKRVRVGFYSLRHTTETIGGRCKDPVAVSAIMGHVPESGDMSAVYREEIGEDRLLAVTNTIREWLFGGEQ
ncbi:tyrosine-type recombinase/integrase [Planctomyces sp. SH-PL14]|uniref:tyrosine-type recombinase/integrase n=1 Tax=Planctomyces sp. SH-PL14 TaxID=1632864 RepID=UPI00078C98A8|nr:site-specific integrase [Planctomyces sp. SH-PL14]AMV18229.1 site-specific tyrosine recombinase XerC [Planctomyces sp. SH-PL14]